MRGRRAGADPGGQRYHHNEAGDPGAVRQAGAARALPGRAAAAEGLLIERLLDAGLAVVAVHPNQVKAMRPRYIAGGK